MTLEDLRAFVAACEAKSMSEAARRLGRTQAAIAQHVRRLEQELGAELLLRMRRGVAPTAVGKTLYEAAQGALTNLEAATREIACVHERNHRRLRLTTSTGILNRFLRPQLATLRQRHPEAEIHLQPANTTQDRLSALREDRADLALIPLTDPLQDLEVRPFRETRLALLVHREHRFAGRKQLKTSELASIEYIAQDQASGTYRHVERALRDAGVSLTPSQIVPDSTATNLLVEMGHGQTFVPANLGPRLERSLAVKAVALPELPPLRMGWAVRSFALLSDVANAFLAVCDEAPRG
jgi:DNA-binding transcriptional LysR family regulator